MDDLLRKIFPFNLLELLHNSIRKSNGLHLDHPQGFFVAHQKPRAKPA
jgi:hypothetical protein